LLVTFAAAPINAVETCTVDGQTGSLVRETGSLVRKIGVAGPRNGVAGPRNRGRISTGPVSSKEGNCIRGWVSAVDPSKIDAHVLIRTLLFDLAFFDHAVAT